MGQPNPFSLPAYILFKPVPANLEAEIKLLALIKPNSKTKSKSVANFQVPDNGAKNLLGPSAHTSVHGHLSSKVAFKSQVLIPQGLVLNNNLILALLRRLNKCKCNQKSLRFEN